MTSTAAGFSTGIWSWHSLTLAIIWVIFQIFH